MRALFRWAVFLAIVGAAVFWFITRPDRLPEEALNGVTGNAEPGALVFAAAGCASCHAAPGTEGDARNVLSGGAAFASEFGTFHAPNISPSAEGIGGWSMPEFANAVMRGVSPEGAHYYPAFPYTSYRNMTVQDVADLYAYMQILPASDVASVPHDVGFPFNIRRSLGGWKFLFMTDDWVLADAGDNARGRYLVEAMGHCGECHTPRNALGGLDRSRWLSGAPNPSGKGNIPNITSGELKWSEADIAEYLKSGFTPEFDTAGGSMVEVIENTAKLPQSDRDAIARYLKQVPAVE